MSYVQENWFGILTTSLVIVGSVILLLSLTISNDSIAYVSICGYSIILFAFCLIIANVFNKTVRVTGGSMSTFLPLFFNNIGPFLLNIGVVTFLLSLTIIYTDRINAGHLLDSYYSFSRLTIFMILIQMAIFYSGMKSKSFKQESKLPSVYTSFSYLVGVILLYMSIIIQTILKYYTTDGFTMGDTPF